MKLLFDQNLSFKLCDRLSDCFPGSSQVRLAGLDQADDKVIWEFAKVIWLRCGNQPSAFVEKLLRDHAEAIAAFAADADGACWEVY
jgi:predicted nuclease of predicted toxin-antitoxin system